MAHIALIDDDQNLLASVSVALQVAGYTVSVYTEGRRALADIPVKQPDLLLLDIKMPDMNGIEVLAELRRDSDIPVIFLTSKNDETDEVTGLLQGADDYITKPFSQPMLLARIATMLRRVPSLGGEDIMVCGDLMMNNNRREVLLKGRRVSLTVTEYSLLQSLVSRPGFVKSRDQLLDMLNQNAAGAEDRSIDSHIKRLRQKLRQADSAFVAIETLYGIGYRYNEP